MSTASSDETKGFKEEIEGTQAKVNFRKKENNIQQHT